MPIQFQCPSCSRIVQSPDSAAGKRVKCPHCATLLNAPGAARQPGQLPAKIDFPCPSCRQAMRVPASAAGKQAKCPMCSTLVAVPGGGSPANAPASPHPPSNPIDPAAPTPAPQEDLFAGFPSSQRAAPQRAAPQPTRPAQPPQRQSVQHTANPYQTNPYAAGGAATAPSGSASVSSMTMPPAICLLVVTILWLLWLTIAFIGTLLGFNQNNNPQIDQTTALILQVSFHIIFLAVQCLIAYGCISMIKLRNRGVAMTAMIFAVIPCFCSPGFILGIPFGIWGLIVLNNQNVIRAFR